MEYKISDPVDSNRLSLRIPPSTLQKIIYLRPSNSDLSYLFFQFDSHLTITVTTPFGPVTVNSSATESASLELNEPVSNETDLAQFSGPKVWDFDYKYPAKGTYFVQIKSFTDGFVEPWMYFFDIFGGAIDMKKKYFISSNRPTILKIQYDPEDINTIRVSRVVLWEDIINDITTLEKMGAFKNHGIPQSIRSAILEAQSIYELEPENSIIKVNDLAKKVKDLSNLLILKETARELVLEDLELLKASL